MSRRFGRNQRRRMREELASKDTRVAQLDSGLAMSNGLLRKTSQDISMLRDAIKGISQRVGHMAMLECEAEPFEGANLDYRRMRKFYLEVPKMYDVRSYEPAMIDTMSALHVAREVMHVLDVDTLRDRMSQQLHCRVYFDGHEIGYSMSEQAIRGYGAEALARKIAPEIARALAEKIKRPSK